MAALGLIVEKYCDDFDIPYDANVLPHLRYIITGCVEIPKLPGHMHKFFLDLTFAEDTTTGETEKAKSRLIWEERIRFAFVKNRFLDLMAADGFYTPVEEFNLPSKKF